MRQSTTTSRPLFAGGGVSLSATCYRRTPPIRTLKRATCRTETRNRLHASTSPGSAYRFSIIVRTAIKFYQTRQRQKKGCSPGLRREAKKKVASNTKKRHERVHMLYWRNPFSRYKSRDPKAEGGEDTNSCSGLAAARHRLVRPQIAPTGM